MTKVKHGRNGFSKKRNKKYSGRSHSEKEEKAKRKIMIYTHQNVDLDAIFSVWFVIKFMFPGFEYELVFVPASYDGKEIGENDIAVDIEAGGKGIKGSIDNDGFHHSSFYTLFKKTRLSSSVHQALFPLVNIIDQKDVYGKIKLAPEIIRLDKRSNNSLDSAMAVSLSLQAFQAQYENNDHEVCRVMLDLISGLFKRITDSKTEQAEVERKSFSCGYVFVVETSKRISTAKNVFNNPNNKAYIYVNTKEKSMGVYLSDDLYHKDGFRLRLSDVKKIIEKYGEKIGKGKNEWFLHENGFLLSWGTRKDTRDIPSKIRPEELAFEVNKLIKKYLEKRQKLV